jgi:hypothetical protein
MEDHRRANNSDGLADVRKVLTRPFVIRANEPNRFGDGRLMNAYTARNYVVGHDGWSPTLNVPATPLYKKEETTGIEHQG